MYILHHMYFYLMFSPTNNNRDHWEELGCRDPFMEVLREIEEHKL